MVTCIIDGKNMTSRALAHQEIARAMQLPVLYGSNLDALWDVVTTYDADMTLINAGAMLNALQAYGCKILATLYEAAENNENFAFSVKD